MRITNSLRKKLESRFRIVSRASTGKCLLRPYQKRLFGKQVAFHFGCMKCILRSGEVDEKDIENDDETHFTINMDNGCKF